MRTQTVPCLAALLVAAAVLSACAASTPAGSAPASAVVASSAGSPQVASAAMVSSATPSVSASASSVSASASTLTIGTASSIPSAPGTVGSAALPPVPSAAPVSSGPGDVATPLPDCTPATLKTSIPGKLVFTSAGARSAPWFVGEPADAKGYEGAVAAAVARELGYSRPALAWTTTDRSAVLAGTASGFDVAVGEFVTPDQGGAAVDYTTGYFSLSNSVVAKTGTRAAGVSTLNSLKGFRIGAVGGSAGLSAARTQLGVPVRSFENIPTALAALTDGSADAVVLPTSTAVDASAGFTTVGQLSDGDEQPQQFGMVLAKHSSLTSCVSAAIDQLRVTGTLTTLLKTWIPTASKPLS